MVCTYRYVHNVHNYVVLTCVSNLLCNQYKTYLGNLCFAICIRKTLFCPSAFVSLTPSRHPLRVIKITSPRPIVPIATERSEDGWWPWSDLNRHSLRNLILSQARLPIPPQGHVAKKLFCLLCFDFFYQTCTAIRFVRWFFCRLFRFTIFLFNGFLDCRHFRGQT